MDGEQLGSWVLAATLFVAGLALVWIGRKQAAGTLRRNWFAGLRTWETMRSDAASAGGASCDRWADHRCRRRPARCGGGHRARPPRQGVLEAVVLASAGVTLVLALAGGVRGHRIAARVTREGAP